MELADHQWGFLLGYPSLLFALHVLFFSPLVRPLRIFAVALHELAHAAAVCVTCGHVYEVSVDRFEGGLTTWASRCECCALPLVAAAGYLGLGTYGAVLLLSLHDAAMRGWMLRGLGVLLVFGAAIAARQPRLRLEAAWLGVFAILGVLCSLRPASALAWLYTMWTSAVLCSYAAYDVYDDTVARTLDETDASHFARAVLGDSAYSRAVGTCWLLTCTTMHLGAAVASFFLLADSGPSVRMADASLALYLPFVALLGASLALLVVLWITRLCVRTPSAAAKPAASASASATAAPA